ncbi:MAG: succinylglutamate desuccinylase/aspartoacylase family protein [Proteobacteria bacterium]|nr:succinylglutamate desuccinylase/aspartoacylase family protein [Pseudomonadota bacterium]
MSAEHKPHTRAKRATAAVHPRPIQLEDYRAGSRTDLRIPLSLDSLANPVTVPFVVVRGRHPGPVVGLTAAIHGDELNGIKIIHHVLDRADPDNMHGSLLCAPVANVPAFQAGQRRFPDDERDLNRVFPGKADGTPSQQYAKAFITTFLTSCDYLLDLHTASEGRINSFYVRADLHSEQTRTLALLMDPQIILHASGGDGTLRNAARLRGIPAITVEAGNPNVFHGRIVLEGEQGVFNILIHLGMIRGETTRTDGPAPVICKSSKWLRLRSGGFLQTKFKLCETLRRRQVIAEINDPFGYQVETYKAPYEGIVIGMSHRPVAVPGTRYCHLGVIGEPPPPKQAQKPNQPDQPDAPSPARP